jgi:hypothetical protein
MESSRVASCQGKSENYMTVFLRVSAIISDVSQKWGKVRASAPAASPAPTYFGGNRGN